MNTYDIELPPLPEWLKTDNLGGLVPSEIRYALINYARAAVEADRKRRQKPALTAEKIRIIWKETQARMGCGGDPVLWFARAIERAHGISAPQPTEPVKVSDDLAHEIWAAAQTAPGEGIMDGVTRIKALLRKTPHPAITHCEGCGCDWLDNGLNPAWCPYCKISALREALEVMVEMVEMNGFGRAYAMDVARAALAQKQEGA